MIFHNLLGNFFDENEKKFEFASKHCPGFWCREAIWIFAANWMKETKTRRETRRSGWKPRRQPKEREEEKKTKHPFRRTRNAASCVTAEWTSPSEKSANVNAVCATVRSFGRIELLGFCSSFVFLWLTPSVYAQIRPTLGPYMNLPVAL